jgi:zinc protease
MIPEIQESRLPGGLTLWLVEYHTLPLVVLSVVIRGGSDYDPQGKAGLASLTADGIDTGTATQSLGAIAERLEFTGSYFRAHASHDGTVLSLSSMTRYFPESFDIVADLLCNASYPEQEIERLKRQRLTALLQQKDRPGTIASVVFHRRLFGDHHPYGTDPLGNEQGLSQINREDPLLFHRTVYTPGAATIIVVGDIGMPELEERISESLEAWTPSASGGRSRQVTAVPPAGDLVIVDRPGSVQSEIRMGGLGIPRSSPDYHAAMVMNRILGGQFSSRLNANLRERRGLTYGVWSTFQALREAGPFITGGAFHTEKTEEAIRQLLREVEAMRQDGITEEELRFARESLSGSFALAFETPEQIAQALQAIPLYGLPKDTYTTYLDRLRQVTREDVLRVARTYLDTTAMATVVVGDAARIAPTLEGLRPGPTTYASAQGDMLKREDPGALHGKSRPNPSPARR